TALGADAAVVETGGHPLVIGGWVREPRWPTVAISNHLDVQPAMEPEWTRAPFQFAIVGDFYYGPGPTVDQPPAPAPLPAACVGAKTGRVKIPDFYDKARRAGKKEQEQFRKSGFDVKSFSSEHRLTKLRANDRTTIMRRIWAEPTFEVHGFIGGYTGPGVKT